MATKRKSEISEAEDKLVQSGIDQDPDNPEWTKSDFEKACPAEQVLPQIVKAYKEDVLKRRARGPQKQPTKEHISIRIDQDVVTHYRKKGRGWQVQLNEDLRKVAGLAGKHE